ncbi:MAG TPA: hypothetical protein VKC60_16110, partial [Opitutaceae bacterium]|nr:hypothetical protein [Opitutaceae bacterium]
LHSTDFPVEVRAVAGEALHLKKIVSQAPQANYRYRVIAGPVPEIDGVWVWWEEAAPELERIHTEMEKSRLDLLKNLGLTLSHELSNPLVSLVTFSQLAERATKTTSPATDTLGSTEAAPTAIRPAPSISIDIARLQLVQEHAGMFSRLAEPVAHPADLSALLTSLANSRGYTARISDEPAIFDIDAGLLRFAFEAVLDAVSANRLEEGAKNLIISLQVRGSTSERIALVTIEGKRLELDGILPIPTADSVPNQGRLSVFLAREILRLHQGTIHAGPGIRGTDIQISLKTLRK